MMAPIKNEEILAVVQDIQKQVNAFSADLAWIKQEVASTRTALEETRRTLRGSNGDIGLVAGVSALSEKLEAIETYEEACKIHEMDKVIYGDARGEPGILERLRNLEELHGSIKKWVYLIGSTFVLYLLNSIFDIWPRLVEFLK